MALVVGAALVVLGGDDEPASERPATETAGRTTGSETGETAPPPTETRPPGTATAPADTPQARREAASIERTVVAIVQATEESDGPRVCRLVGQAGGDGPSCASAAGVNLQALPTSDELSLDRASTSGPRATVVLADGRRILLRRAGAGWIVTGVSQR